MNHRHPFYAVGFALRLAINQGAINGESEEWANKEHMMHTPEHVTEPRTDWRTRIIGTPFGWALTLLLAALGIYLFATHAGHVFGALPYLILLMCPLMHFFGHGRHGHGESDQQLRK